MSNKAIMDSYPFTKRGLRLELLLLAYAQYQEFIREG